MRQLLKSDLRRVLRSKAFLFYFLTLILGPLLYLFTTRLVPDQTVYYRSLRDYMPGDLWSSSLMFFSLFLLFFFCLFFTAERRKKAIAAKAAAGYSRAGIFLSYSLTLGAAAVLGAAVFYLLVTFVSAQPDIMIPTREPALQKNIPEALCVLAAAILFSVLFTAVGCLTSRGVTAAMLSLLLLGGMLAGRTAVATAQQKNLSISTAQDIYEERNNSSDPNSFFIEQKEKTDRRLRAIRFAGDLNPLFQMREVDILTSRDVSVLITKGYDGSTPYSTEPTPRMLRLPLITLLEAAAAAGAGVLIFRKKEFA